MTDHASGRAGPIAYELHGQNHPGLPLLLIRPLGGSMFLWGRFREILAEKRRIISFDLRGSGASSPDSTWMTTRGLAEDGLRLLDHLEVACADVFGISLGGMAATSLALLAPQRIGRLCLASTTARGLEVSRVGLVRELRMASCFAHPLYDVEASLVRRILSAHFRWNCPSEVRRIELTLQAHPASRRSLLRHALAGLLHDVRGQLGDVRATTLVLAGELDDLLGIAPSRELAAGIPHARFATIAAAGHDLTLEQPEATASRVLEFLRPRESERFADAQV